MAQCSRNADHAASSSFVLLTLNVLQVGVLMFIQCIHPLRLISRVMSGPRTSVKGQG